MRTLVSFIFLLFSMVGFSQNLLVNGGFEEENVCTEYSATCSPEAWISTGKTLDNYIKNYNRSHSGEHCYTLEAGNARAPYQRTFARSRLLCGLRTGNQYKFSMFIKSPHPVLDSIAVYFTTEDIFYEKRKLKDILPAFYLASDKQLKKQDTGWQKIEIIYTARGNETFITIGNFCKRDITGPTGLRLMNQFLIYLDDLSLVPMNEAEHLCSDWEQRKEEIYDQNERHQFMERLIRMQRYNNLPGVSLVSRTSVLIIDTLVLPDILFETNKSVLQTASFRLLDSLVLQAGGKQIDSLVVKGHTDNTGSAARNEKLSLERAEAVAGYIAPRLGKPPVPFHSYGLADRFPVGDNQTPQGRQRNRRVEILLYIRE